MEEHTVYSQLYIEGEFTMVGVDCLFCGEKHTHNIHGFELTQNEINRKSLCGRGFYAIKLHVGSKHDV